MMTEENNNRVLHSASLIFNLAIIAMVAYSISTFFTGKGGGNMPVIGSQCFRYFTNLSNILSALTALVIIPFNVQSLIKGKDTLPFWAMVFKFVGTVSVTVTFLTVVFFLGPTMGYGIMFAGACLYLHALVPIAAIISFVLLENGHRLPFKLSFAGLAPTVLYSIIYLSMVVGAKTWPDFYGFTFGGKMWVVPISMLAMYIATYAFCAGLWVLHNIGGKQKVKEKATAVED